MIGAIIGDMAGCRFENHPHQPGLDPLDFPLFAERTSFTDDTVLSFAVCEALMESSGDPERMQDACCRRFKEFARKYPRAGYGRRFWEWACSREARPFASFGHGSAMRVSPVGWSFETLEETECMARASALPSHSHPEGIKGACSVAAAIFLARKGKRPEEIRDHVQRAYGYDMERHLRDIGNTGFDSTCQGSVPQAIICALETASAEEAVRAAILLRGDADTQGAIAGSIAEALWGVPEDLKNQAEARLDEHLRGCLQRWRQWLAGRRA